MLMQLGSVSFQVYPLNTHEHSRTSEYSFAEKSVLGRRPPLEDVGLGAETMELSGRVFPERLGGLGNLAALEAAHKAGKPLFLMRGDGRPLGFFVIERFRERHTYIDPKGVGKVIEFDVTLKRSDPPSASGYFSSIVGMLRGL